jgi:hypothetical protein
MSERTRSNGQGLTRKAHAAAVRAGCSRDATKLLLLLAHARAASSPTVRELGARLGSLQPPALDQLLSELTTARLRYAAWQASKHRRDDYRLLFPGERPGTPLKREQRRGLVRPARRDTSKRSRRQGCRAKRREREAA